MKAAKAALSRDHSVDVALFGRMVADDANLNVDAACQVAHAISTHAVATEFDYYTAVDDQNPAEETGAGMIGTIEFDSATLYRYATINVPALLRSLGDTEATAQAVEAFVRSFATSMPTGKQNTFANRTAPDAVVVMVRPDRPVNLVGASRSRCGAAVVTWRALASRWQTTPWMWPRRSAALPRTRGLPASAVALTDWPLSARPCSSTTWSSGWAIGRELS